MALHNGHVLSGTQDLLCSCAGRREVQDNGHSALKQCGKRLPCLQYFPVVTLRVDTASHRLWPDGTMQTVHQVEPGQRCIASRRKADLQAPAVTAVELARRLSSDTAVILETNHCEK